MHGSRTVEGVGSDRNLRVIDAREVAGTSGLVLFGLDRERVRVDTRVGRASVVVEGLDLVEVLALLFLETVLAVEDELEGVEGTNGFFSELRGGTGLADVKHGSTVEGGGHEAVGLDAGHVGLKDDVVGVSGEVPQGRRRDGVGEAPHKLLDGVVVGQPNLLGGTSVDGVSTSVLHLLDQVFVTLLGEAATLFGVQVDVVGPHLEHRGVAVGGEVRRQVDVDAHFVVLKGDQGQVQTGVPVEEEEEGQVDSLAVDGSGHLTVSGLLGLIQVKL